MCAQERFRLKGTDRKMQQKKKMERHTDRKKTDGKSMQKDT